MLDPAVGALLAALFALLFASAALHKLRAPAHFSGVLAAYRVLPAPLTQASVLVPVLELAVATGLIVPATRSGAAGAAAAVLVAYAAAIAVNLGRGRRELACGCGGPDEHRPIAPWMVVRNLLLAATLALLTLPWLQRPFAAPDILTVGGGTVVAALIYASLERLLSRVAPQGARLQGSS